MYSRDSCIIDGSVKEGGGQILRTALALSAIIGKSLVIKSIRAGRASPGLRPQHLNCINLLTNICKAHLEGAFMGSTKICFDPLHINPGEYFIDIKTAGSVSLLLQASLPCLIFSNSNEPNCSILNVKGGTNAEMAPPIDYISLLLVPLLKKYVLPGFYPKGGGDIKVDVKKNEVKGFLKPLSLLIRGNIISIKGLIYITQTLPISMAKEMEMTMKNLLAAHFSNVSIEIVINQESSENSYGNGAGIILIAYSNNGSILSGSALSKRGVKGSDVGKAAVKMLIDNVNHGGCVDEFTQDQLLIYMALAKGRSEIRIGPLTLHSESVIYVIEKMIPRIKFEIKNTEDGTQIISCNGIGVPL